MRQKAHRARAADMATGIETRLIWHPNERYGQVKGADLAADREVEATQPGRHPLRENRLRVEAESPGHLFAELRPR